MIEGKNPQRWKYGPLWCCSSSLLWVFGQLPQAVSTFSLVRHTFIPRNDVFYANVCPRVSLQGSFMCGEILVMDLRPRFLHFGSKVFKPEHHLTFSRMVPSCKPGPAQGFFLLKGSFSLPLCWPRGSGSGFLPQESIYIQFYCKRRNTKQTELNWISLRYFSPHLLQSKRCGSAPLAEDGPHRHKTSTQN